MTSEAPTESKHTKRQTGWLVICAALILGLFAFPATAMAKDEKPATVVVCDQHKDDYRIKMVLEDKVAKRLETHPDDGVPGGPVPGMEGYNFGPDCVPVLACTSATVVVGFLPAHFPIVIRSTGDNSFSVGGTAGETIVPADALPGTVEIFKARKGERSLGTIHLECGQTMMLFDRSMLG